MRKQIWCALATLSQGCYLLRTNLTEPDPATRWKQYLQLTEAEWAFRIEKGDLGIRPTWHQNKNRVLGHILVRFPGLVLWKALALWKQPAGLGDAPRKLIEKLATIKTGGAVLPAQMADGSLRTIHLRRVTTPDEARKVLLNRLGLPLPQRLRRIDEVDSDVVTTSARTRPWRTMRAAQTPPTVQLGKGPRAPTRPVRVDFPRPSRPLSPARVFPQPGTSDITGRRGSR